MEIHHDGHCSVKCTQCENNIYDSVTCDVVNIINNSATLDNNRNRLGAIKLYSNRNENSITFLSVRRWKPFNLNFSFF